MGKIAELARLDAAKSGLFKKTSIVAATIVLPLFIALWVAFKADIDQVNGSLFWVVLILLAGSNLFLASLNLSGAHLVQQAFFENQDLKVIYNESIAENEQIKQSLYSLSIIQEAAIAWRVMQRKYFKNIVSVEDTKESIEEILSILRFEGDKIFDFNAGERWNFSVYIFDDRDEFLKPIWREKHRNHPSDGAGRHWKRGQGHIGKAFSDKTSKITGDASDPGVVDMVRAPEELLKEYDDEVYRSFASIPIGPIDNGDEPLGVLTATSDQKERFDLESCLILRHVAGVLANLIYMNQIDLHILIDDSTEQGS